MTHYSLLLYKYLKLSMYFILTAQLNLNGPHFKRSTATNGFYIRQGSS